MKSKKINRIMIAGTNSGCGKTTVTCAILKVLKNKGIDVTSFKCGPDYIDPMFHSEIIETKSRNIDLFLCGEKAARYLFAKNSSDNTDISVIEGVMGFYDGRSIDSSENSSWDISNKFEIPVVLVVDCKGASVSVGAMIKGYLDFYKNKIKAVILNNVSKHLYKTYKEMIENQLRIFVAGYMPYEPDVALESRHLGLVTAKEIDSLKQKLDLLSSIAEETIDTDLLIDIAKNSEPFDYEDIQIKKICDVKIGVAKDRAFCFYYQDSLDLLEKMGAKLQTFSPSEDHKLSEVDGLIIGGGYPELYLEKLSNNKEMLNSIKDAAITGMPIFAECGGFMYLGKNIGTCSMAGILDLSFEMTGRLQNFGYVTLTAKENTELLECGETAYAHEYHYSKDNSKSGCLTAKMQSGKTWEAGCCKDNVFALYPHIHFWGNIGMAERFVLKCEEYRKNKETGMTAK